MWRNKRWIVVVLVIAGLHLLACQRDTGIHHKVEPVHVEHIQGSEFSRVIFTENAMKRIDIQTGQVREVPIHHSKEINRIVVPYSSVIYGPHGQTWVYTSPEPRTFVRHQINVDFIEGEMVVLNDGPAVGTEIATVGAAEMYGAEFGLGH
jgi:hypothetical protein